MIDLKEIIERINKAHFFQVFVVDDKGVGYCSGPFKGNVSVTTDEIFSLIIRMEKEINYLKGLITKSGINKEVS